MAEGDINWELIEQLMELDDDDQHEFSRQILEDFFVQMKAEIPKLKQLIAERKLKEVASLGHFLKGSSAAVGAVRISSICEKIQRCPQEEQEIPKLQALAEELQDTYPTTREKLLSKFDP